jgi:hypothetical protein
MALHAKRHTGSANAYSKADWLTPEMLATANRARRRVLREIVIAIGSIAKLVGTTVRARHGVLTRACV